MAKTRVAAYQRATEGFLQVLQKGSVVANPSEETVKGPIRLRLNAQEGDSKEVAKA